MDTWSDEEALDWGAIGCDKGKYYEYFSTQENTFFYINKETGHETVEEPEAAYYDIVRYCTGTEGRTKYWFPDNFPSAPKVEGLPPPEDVLDTDCTIIPPLMSREDSTASVVSLKELASDVDLKSPYAALMDHLRGCEDLDLSAWRKGKRNSSQWERGRTLQERKSITILDEIRSIPVASVEVQEEVTLSPGPPQNPKGRFKIWYLLGSLFALLFGVRQKG